MTLIKMQTYLPEFSPGSLQSWFSRDSTSNSS